MRRRWHAVGKSPARGGKEPRTPQEGDNLRELFVTPAQPLRAAGDTLPRAQLKVLGGVALVVLLLLAGQSALLQLSRSAVFRTQAEGNRLRVIVDYAPRGVVFDRFGTQLVQNVPSTDVVLIPALLPADVAPVVETLREVFPRLPAAEISATISESDRGSQKPLPLVADITHEELVAVLSRREHLPGVEVESRVVREYVGEGMFAHVLGYTGRISHEEIAERPTYLLTESIGKSGLERAYEHVLRGVHGSHRLEVDAAGNPQSDLGAVPSQPGTNLRLHLDAALQERLSTALHEHIARAGAQKGAAVALDPRTGAVRALVSVPTYDHTTLARGANAASVAAILHDTQHPLLNRATQGQYPPGSTFKLAVAVAALEEGIVTAQTTVESTGGLRVGQWFFPDWKPGGHGRTDLLKGLSESVNTFFYIAGGGYGDRIGLGIERMVTWARSLGFGAPTGIDLPGEETGFLPSVSWKEDVKGEPWYIGDTYHAAIGQGDILVTPLQLATATAAIANGGTVYTPQVVDAFVRSDGSVIQQLSQTARRSSVMAPETAALIRRGMRAVVLEGSGRGLASAPVPVAGKTGTAQTPVEGITHAWFTSFAPAQDPEIVLTVVVEDGGAGDLVAVPVARDVYQWYFSERSHAANIPAVRGIPTHTERTTTRAFPENP